MAEKKLSIHPLARQFPLMSDDEFAALKDDIAEHGLVEPIVLFEGKILDGRNRYKACQATGVKPRFERFKGTAEEAAAVSISQNLQRRHLSKSQQAMFLVRSGVIAGPKPTRRKRQYRTGDSAIRHVSKRYGVSHVSIYKAMFVEAHKPELARRVLAGELSVAKAEKQIRDEQPGATRTSAAGRGVAAKLRRMRSVQSTVKKAASELDRACNTLASQRRVDRAHVTRALEHLRRAREDLDTLRTA